MHKRSGFRWRSARRAIVVLVGSGLVLLAAWGAPQRVWQVLFGIGGVLGLGIAIGVPSMRHAHRAIVALGSLLLLGLVIDSWDGVADRITLPVFLIGNWSLLLVALLVTPQPLLHTSAVRRVLFWSIGCASLICALSLMVFLLVQPWVDAITTFALQSFAICSLLLLPLLRLLGGTDRRVPKA